MVYEPLSLTTISWLSTNIYNHYEALITSMNHHYNVFIQQMQLHFRALPFLPLRSVRWPMLLRTARRLKQHATSSQRVMAGNQLRQGKKLSPWNCQEFFLSHWGHPVIIYFIKHVVMIFCGHFEKSPYDDVWILCESFLNVSHVKPKVRNPRMPPWTWSNWLVLPRWWTYATELIDAHSQPIVSPTKAVKNSATSPWNHLTKTLNCSTMFHPSSHSTCYDPLWQMTNAQTLGFLFSQVGFTLLWSIA